MTSTADPAVLRGRVDESTGRLLAGTAAVTDAQAREPSLLPGWTRGHLLTHLARNADGLRNLLTWARTGVMTPQYHSAAARDEDIRPEPALRGRAARRRREVGRGAGGEAASLPEAACRPACTAFTAWRTRPGSR